MAKPHFYWDGTKNKWVFTDPSGAEVAEIGGDSIFKGGVKYGGGTAFTKEAKLTGTIGAMTSVGTAATAVGTVTGMTGLAIGDVVTIMPKAAIGGLLGIGGAYVPTTNTLNVWITNPSPDSAGSLIATGFDVIYKR